MEQIPSLINNNSTDINNGNGYQSRRSNLSFYSFIEHPNSNSSPQEMTSSILSNVEISEKKFIFKTPIQQILKRFCDNNINDYIFHTKIFLEYDDENAFIFIFKNSIVFTHLSLDDSMSISPISPSKENITNNEKNQTANPNPIIYIIKFSHVYYYELQVNENDGNHVIIQFFENDYIKKSEIKLKFSFLKDSYFIHHFIKKYYILFWQKLFEESVLLENKTQIYNYHFFVKKLNRWGSLQDRILLITNRVKLSLKY
jgi:hypothetical protein